MVLVTPDDRLAAELSVDTEWDVREFLRTATVDVSGEAEERQTNVRF